MEEKERYILESYNEAFCQIHDTESDEWYLRKDLVKDLLNQQDAKIKELEAKLPESEKLRAIVKGKVLMVEDGSVDIDKLERDGFYIIVYRNGATPPQYLKD